MGEMDKEDAREHPDKNIITRAIGVGREVSADFFETAVRADDTILMCSDGLTNMMMIGYQAYCAGRARYCGESRASGGDCERKRWQG